MDKQPLTTVENEGFLRLIVHLETLQLFLKICSCTKMFIFYNGGIVIPVTFEHTVFVQVAFIILIRNYETVFQVN